MAAYQAVTSTRTTVPDVQTLVQTLRSTVAPDVGLQMRDLQHYVLKKAAPWVNGEITAAQTAIDGAPEFDPAIAEVDTKALKAVVLGLFENWASPLMTRTQLRARILTIWRGL